jgi:NAD(P)-dependent dehydrogenase (short-subunit alcohol dehydrogenase family)
MTKSPARALAPEIRVMGVAPGVVDTGFVPGRGAEFSAKTAATTPLRRVATAEDDNFLEIARSAATPLEPLIEGWLAESDIEARSTRVTNAVPWTSNWPGPGTRGAVKRLKHSTAGRQGRT